MKPLNNSRFWFYSQWETVPLDECDGVLDWLSKAFKGSDEHGHHTVVIPFGKGRAVVIAYRAGYKGFRKCEWCVMARKQTLDFEQDALYVQTYWNIEDYDDVMDLDNVDWDEALGVI